MTIYKITTEAVRERFMERPLYERFEDYVSADSRDQAHTYVWEMLRHGGWTINKITVKEVFLQDIRSKA